VVVDFPTRLTGKERELLERLRDLQSEGGKAAASAAVR
jgi:hypothetical protein